MQQGEKLYFCAKLLMEIAEDIQQQLGESHQARSGPFGWKAFIKEFCTIRVGTSRRGGHTYALTKLVRDDFTGTVIVVTPSVVMRQILNRELESQGIDTNRIRYVTAATAIGSLIGLSELDAVVVDGGCQTKPQVLEELIDTMTPVCAVQQKPFWVVVMQ